MRRVICPCGLCSIAKSSNVINRPTKILNFTFSKNLDVHTSLFLVFFILILLMYDLLFTGFAIDLIVANDKSAIPYKNLFDNRTMRKVDDG